MYLGVILLGLIQGVAEFLPISSSAHLIIFRDLFGIGSKYVSGDIGTAFDIALHFGTFLAIIIYFYKDFWNMVIKGLTKPKTEDGKLLWYLVVATIPAALMGVLFEEVIDNFFRKKIIIIAFFLAFVGVIIYLVDKNSAQTKTIKKMTIKDAFLIGCSQVLALMPGFSRSGTTIAMSRLLKLKRDEAAKFSFFLSVPIVLGATVYFFLKNGFNVISDYFMIFALGTLTSFIIGMLCINFLLKYLKKNDFKLFMWYRLILAIIIIVVVLFK